MRLLPSSVVIFLTIAITPPAFGDELEACATGAEHAADNRDAGHLREALRSFEACAKDECPRVVREDCRRGIAAIRSTGPHLVVRVRDSEGNDVVDARVTIDGEDVDASALTAGTLVDPGQHIVRASQVRFGSVEHATVTTVVDGVRTVELSFRPPLVPLVPLVPLDAAPDRTAAWISGGVGLAFIAGFATIGTWTYLDYQRLGRDCGTHCEHSEVAKVEARGVVADVSLGVGVVALAIASVFWFTAAPRKSGAQSGALAAW